MKYRKLGKTNLNVSVIGVSTTERAMATWALAWCLQHPAVTCAIPGCKTVEQVEMNASAADLDVVHQDHPQAVP